MITPDPTSLADLFTGIADHAAAQAAPRAPRVPERVGVRREPLPPGMRRAVLLRDRFTCLWCYSAPRGRRVLLEIDHVVPWSAGGADHPVNLRTLCEPCNQARSNRVTGDERRPLPIVLRCRRCETGDVGTARHLAAYCLTCRSEGAAPYLADLILGGPIPTTGVPAPTYGDDPPIAYRPGFDRALALLHDRTAAQVVACPWCGAEPGDPCTDPAGNPLTKSAAHPSRLDTAHP